jgi:DNA modification methylase
MAIRYPWQDGSADASDVDVSPYYKRTFGAAYLGDSMDLMRHLPDNSISLIVTSPPFALTRQKEYGNKAEDEYVAWFLGFCREFKRILREDGSLVIDLGGAYLPGHPVRSIYQFEILVHLCKDEDLRFFLAQEFYHYNPARLPAPAEWVNIRRIRVKDSVNVVWWLSKTEYPKANNRRVLQPYSASMMQLLKNGYRAKARPSGWDISTKFGRDNNGAIPPNYLVGVSEEDVPDLLALANTESNSAYMRRCSEAGISPHPARFPTNFAEFFIRFLTEEGDVVLDPFAGSNTTGFVAETLKRRWLAFENNSDYLDGSLLRFEPPVKFRGGSNGQSGLWQTDTGVVDTRDIRRANEADLPDCDSEP